LLEENLNVMYVVNRCVPTAKPPKARNGFGAKIQPAGPVPAEPTPEMTWPGATSWDGSQTGYSPATNPHISAPKRFSGASSGVGISPRQHLNPPVRSTGI